MEKVEKRDPPYVGILNSNHILNIHHIHDSVIFVNWQYFICKLLMLYTLNGWSNEESWEKGPLKSGNSEFKLHLKHSSYLWQCHICALTIFYLWTSNVIFPKLLTKWRKLRKGTPPKSGSCYVSKSYFKQSSYVMLMSYVCINNILFMNCQC